MKIPPSKVEVGGEDGEMRGREEGRWDGSLGEIGMAKCVKRVEMDEVGMMIVRWSWVLVQSVVRWCICTVMADDCDFKVKGTLCDVPFDEVTESDGVLVGVCILVEGKEVTRESKKQFASVIGEARKKDMVLEASCDPCEMTDTVALVLARCVSSFPHR